LHDGAAVFINRIIQENVYSSFNASFVTTLLGPRRVGKSMLVQHFIQQHPDCLWVLLNLDDRLLRDQIEQQKLRELIQVAAKQIIGGDRKIWVAIDEAQKCPAIFEQIKILYDEYKDDKDVIKFILTGSGQLSLHQLSAESLAGRVCIFRVHEFVLREAMQLFNPAYQVVSSLADKILRTDFAPPAFKIDECLFWYKESLLALSELLVFGGFPEVLQSATKNSKQQYLSNYLQTYLEKDIRDLETIFDLRLYNNMMRILAEQTGSQRSEQAIAESLCCSRDTLNKYRGFLIATLLYEEIYPFIGSSLRQLVKSPKGYLLNNGLISNLTGIDDFAVLEKTALIGHRLENWLLNELKVRLSLIAERSEITYWRTRGGAEVDFVVRIGSDFVCPFEVTYAKKIQAKKIRNLMSFLAEEPKAQWGYYVYLGDFYCDIAQKIVFIPAWAM